MYLSRVGVTEPDSDDEGADLIWMHALAIGYAPAYLAENGDGVRQDWPRVPLPDSRELLLSSARLGRRIAALLDTDEPVPGVTIGSIRAELRLIGVISRVGGGSLDPDAGDLEVTVGWGHPGNDGVVMPGAGRAVRRSYNSEELNAIEAASEAAGVTPQQVIERLGGATWDVYLNDSAYVSNVPECVWRYTIGGYQVIKKWLSYREAGLLGRPLRAVEAQGLAGIARRITSILLMESALDANYTATKLTPYLWPQ